MPDLTTRLLDESTFPAFAAMVEKNKIWGGCWCLGFHHQKGEPRETRREEKECWVREGRTHAALVFDGEMAVGWCQFGRTDELPGIKHQKRYAEGLTDLPDWRITCFVVDKEYRCKGVAALALQAALDEIERQGGGLVESYPEEVRGRKTSSAFLYNATVSLFERHGFTKVRQIGKDHWVVQWQME